MFKMDIHKAKNLLINYLKSNNKHSIKENKLEIVETDVCDAIIVNIKFLIHTINNFCIII